MERGSIRELNVSLSRIVVPKISRWVFSLVLELARILPQKPVSQLAPNTKTKNFVPMMSLRSLMTKITVVTYVHEKHKVWIPFWISQLQKQTYRDFDILLIAHNWKIDPLEYNCWLDGHTLTPDRKIEKNTGTALGEDLWDRFGSLEHSGPPLIGDVINFGVKNIETEYFAHWDVDDWIHPDRMKIQAEFIDKNPVVDFLGTRMVGFRGEPAEEMTKLDYFEPNEPNAQVEDHKSIYQCLLHRGQNCLGHTTMIYRVKAMKNVGGFSMSDVKVDGKSPDFETWKKAIMAGYRFHRLPQLCALWRLDSSSIRV
jgi:hypothetical protein